MIFFYRLFTGGGPYENRTAGIPGNKHKLTPAAKAMGVYLPVSTPLATGKVLIANLIRLFQATGNVSFGSLADLLVNISSMSAFGGEAAVRDKRPAIRHEVVRRYSPVQHMSSIGLLVYFPP